jgi:hypothetical protein
MGYASALLERWYIRQGVPNKQEKGRWLQSDRDKKHL